jgi:hypothetical protein
LYAGGVPSIIKLSPCILPLSAEHTADNCRAYDMPSKTHQHQVGSHDCRLGARSHADRTIDQAHPSAAHPPIRLPPNSRPSAGLSSSSTESLPLNLSYIRTGSARHLCEIWSALGAAHKLVTAGGGFKLMDGTSGYFRCYFNMNLTMWKKMSTLAICTLCTRLAQSEQR